MFSRQLSHSGIWPKQKEGEQLVHSDLAQTSSIKKKRAAGPPDLAQIASKKKGSYWPQKDMNQNSKMEHHSNGQL